MSFVCQIPKASYFSFFLVSGVFVNFRFWSIVQATLSDSLMATLSDSLMADLEDLELSEDEFHHIVSTFMLTVSIYIFFPHLHLTCVTDFNGGVFPPSFQDNDYSPSEGEARDDDYGRDDLDYLKCDDVGAISKLHESQWYRDIMEVS